MHAKALPHHHSGRLYGCSGIPDGMREPQGDIVRPVWEQSWCVSGCGSFCIDHGRQGLIVNLDLLGGVLGLGTTAGDNHGNRFANVTYSVARQGVLRRGAPGESEACLKGWRWQASSRHWLHPRCQVRKPKHPYYSW
jgi:hypothetical protein